MTDATQGQEAAIDGAKRVVRILARRRRATAEGDLLVIFGKEGGGGVWFKPAISYALLHGWITRRSDGFLTGPRLEGLRAVGLDKSGRPCAR
jgi:hypothetical protein